MRLFDIIIDAPPASLPVTLDGFVNHARLNGITVQREPELLNRELAAATNRAEQWLRRSLMEQTLRALFIEGVQPDMFPGLIVLPRGNVISVLSVETTAGAAVQYTFDGWAAITAQSSGGNLNVKWKSGYGATPDKIPAPIIEGIYEYATTLYEDRLGARPVRGEERQAKLPQGVEDNWRQYQIEVSG